MPRFTAILTSVLRRNTRSKVTIQSIGILQPCRKGNKTVNYGKLIFTNNGVTWIWVQVFNLCCGILNRSIPYTLRLFCNSLEMTSKCGDVCHWWSYHILTSSVAENARPSLSGSFTQNVWSDFGSKSLRNHEHQHLQFIVFKIAFPRLLIIKKSNLTRERNVHHVGCGSSLKLNWFSEI